MDAKQRRCTTLWKLTQIAAVFFVLWPQAGHAFMEITPRVSAGAEYTDNVRLVPDNAESDVITTVTPGLTLDLSGRPAGLTLSYDPSYVDYADGTYEDYWRHRAAGTGWWQPVKSTRLELTDTFLKTEDPISDEDLTVRRTRNPYTRNTVTARADYQFGDENRAYVDGLHTFLENEDPTIEDSERFGGSAGVAYWFNVRWGVDVDGEYYRAEYEESEDFTDLVGRLRLNHRFNPHFTGFVGYAHTFHDNDDDSDDFQIYDGSIGFDYAISKSMDLGMSVHYFVRDFEDSHDQSETPVNLSLSKRFQSGSISLDGEGGYNYTTTSAENLGYYTYYQGGLSADYAFTRRLTGDANALYAYRDYKDTLPAREDDVFRAGCGLSFQLLRWLSMRAGYQYRTVNSTEDVNDYKENRVSLQFTVRPEQPFRL
ncbi:outer membrane beta-barrel protein [uncultured Desulfosarcina sp.]|uniref:outer membrane beta-barrel protein n=1 Tax=uncultured Desulfosarcina sp. TaxID=218289 RepID=UPI0029C6F724|nr:outer membrane beta-barrel protein [uncultured Desulfosarcina sp.]